MHASKGYTGNVCVKGSELNDGVLSCVCVKTKERPQLYTADVCNSVYCIRLGNRDTVTVRVEQG
jgi:hypothetical protein